MAKLQLPKLAMRVRFPLPAPNKKALIFKAFSIFCCASILFCVFPRILFSAYKDKFLRIKILMQNVLQNAPATNYGDGGVLISILE